MSIQVHVFPERAVRPALGSRQAKGHLVSVNDDLRAALVAFSQLPVGKPEAAEYMESWQLHENHWELISYKEDLALTPDLEWPDELKRLALAAYNESFSKFLEDGEYYVLDWPPSGYLVGGGDWGWPRLEGCDEHDDDHPDSECAYCIALVTAFNDGKPTCYIPAEWSWTLNVETWRLAELPSGQRRPARVWADDDAEEGSWTFGCTRVPPWEVWFSTWAGSAKAVADIQPK